MPPSGQGSTSVDKPLSPVAAGLATASLALLALFLLQGLSPLLAPRLLLPSWQLRVASTLISAAPLALTGLALHKLATDLRPSDRRSRARHKRFASLALVAALGFLLLIPLQISAGLRQTSTIQDFQSSRILNAEKRLAAMRQVVASAASNQEMIAGLQKLDGPVLGPADIAQPLPLLRAQVNAVLDQAALQIRREREDNPPLRRAAVLPELIRNSISSLVLCLGFAALSRRPGAYQSPLEELQSALERRSVYKQARRRSNPLLDLLDRISLLWTR